MLGGLAAEQERDAQFLFHWALEEDTLKIEDEERRIDLRSAIFHPITRLIEWLEN